MRIISGFLRGRSLAKFSTDNIRPTSDQNREALFNILMHEYCSYVENARVLDLFAGTGALGLEALSRGARYCVFIEKTAEGCALIQTNIKNLQLEDQAKILKRDATNLRVNSMMEPFNLVFIDPPYGKKMAEKALKSVNQSGWLMRDALCVIEESLHSAFSYDSHFVLREERSYKKTSIKFLQKTAHA